MKISLERFKIFVRDKSTGSIEEITDWLYWFQANHFHSCKEAKEGGYEVYLEGDSGELQVLAANAVQDELDAKEQAEFEASQSISVSLRSRGMSQDDDIFKKQWNCPLIYKSSDCGYIGDLPACNKSAEDCERHLGKNWYYRFQGNLGQW